MEDISSEEARFGSHCLLKTVAILAAHMLDGHSMMSQRLDAGNTLLIRLVRHCHDVSLLPELYSMKDRTLSTTGL